MDHQPEVKVPVDCLSAGDASVSFSKVFKTLGVLLDSDLSFSDHVSSLGGAVFFFFFLRELCVTELNSSIPYTQSSTCHDRHRFFFFFILDYCNSLLNGLPSAQVNRSSSGSSEQMVLLES